MARKDPRRRRYVRRLGSIERELLEELSAGDLLYGFLLSARSTRRMFRLARERAAYRQRRKQAIQRLIDEEFINSSANRLSISESGKGALGVAIGIARSLAEKKVWDGKWRIVVFDIPEKYAALRNRIRTLLKKIGFVQLQQSVWVFPYECEDLTLMIKKESDLSAYILYGVLERIDDESRLKRAFGL